MAAAPRYLTLLVLLGALVAPTSASNGAVAAEPDWKTLEARFRELPIEASRQTGPLFWLHGDQTKERLEHVLDKVAEGGNGTFVAESRGHNDWLGEGWYRDLGICLDAAHRHDLTMWIFDERWWPSHCIDGRVPPQHAAKVLLAEEHLVIGPSPVRRDGFEGPDYLAAVAGQVTDDDKMDGATLVDLAPFISRGTLDWSAPSGVWRVMRFSRALAPGVGGLGAPQRAVDGASRESVDWYLETVYQPHFARFGADFGAAIAGFFYDEPETPGDWGPELDRVLAERQVDWKLAYVAYKFGLAGDQQSAAEFQYRDSFAEAWGRTMFGGLARWCHERGVASVGHFVEHGQGYLSPGSCAGDLMRLQRYSDMGGMDVVFNQFRTGYRDAFGDPCWQMPKLASSVSHVFGKTDDLALAEIFGARGQSLTYSEMKWWTDHLLVSGINFMIPHSFNPRAPRDTDCPPYFYMDEFEPRWPLYRVWADYASRATVLLQGGHHVCPVALLFAGNLGQVGPMIAPEKLSENLQDALLDVDWLPCDVFESEAELDGSEVALHGERYRVLIVPAAEAIPYGTLAKARRFFESGGVVVGYGMLPSKSITPGRDAADIAELREGIWGSAPEPATTALRRNDAGGCSFFLAESPTPEQLRAALLDNAGLEPRFQLVAGDAGGKLHAVHRVRSGRDVFFVCDQNHEGPARAYEFRIVAAGEPEVWDPLRNEITTPRFRRTSPGAVEISLTMEPGESLLLVMRPPGAARPPRSDAGSAPDPVVIEVTRESQPLQAAPAPPPALLATGTPPPAPTPKLTVSPLSAPAPFRGTARLASDLDVSRSRIHLEMEGLPAPEYAAAVFINGAYAGGIIGRPFRLDVTGLLRPDENTIEIVPQAPKAVRLLVSRDAATGR